MAAATPKPLAEVVLYTICTVQYSGQWYPQVYFYLANLVFTECIIDVMFVCESGDPLVCLLWDYPKTGNHFNSYNV